ncbi:glyceraldehyde-3-phosphate dehydrogenase, partial [Sulfitobacter sp. 1A12126]
ALPETQEIEHRQLRVFGWYDNEWGFSARMLDMASRIAHRCG